MDDSAEVTIDACLLSVVKAMGKNYEIIRENNPKTSLVKEYLPANKDDVRSTVISVVGGFRVHILGPMESVLERCTYLFTEAAGIKTINNKDSDQMKVDIKKLISAKSSIIGLAVKDYNIAPQKENEVRLGTIPEWTDTNQFISDLTLICIIGLDIPAIAKIPTKDQISAELLVKIYNHYTAKYGYINSEIFEKIFLDSDTMVRFQSSLYNAIHQAFKELEVPKKQLSYLEFKYMVYRTLQISRECIEAVEDNFIELCKRIDTGKAERKSNVLQQST